MGRCATADVVAVPPEESDRLRGERGVPLDELAATAAQRRHRGIVGELIDRECPQVPAPLVAAEEHGVVGDRVGE